MKYGIFISYLLFLSIKSIKTPTTFVEASILGIILIFSYYGTYLRSNLKLKVRSIKLEESKLAYEHTPEKVDPEVAKLERENTLRQLRLRQKIADQELSRRTQQSKIEQGGVFF